MLATSNFINYLMNKECCFIYVISLIAIVGCNNNRQNISSKQQQADSVPVVSAAKVKTILFFGNSLTAGYLLNPANRLGIEAKIVYRSRKSSIVNTSEFYFNFGIKTSLYNLYHDF